MDPQEKEQLQYHLDAIAAILYQKADPAELRTLEGIEKRVRTLAQEHVLPQLGIFLSTTQQTEAAANNEP